jgi:hypothetical protein
MAQALAPANLTVVRDDGHVHFGDLVQLAHAGPSEAVLAADIHDMVRPYPSQPSHAVRSLALCITFRSAPHGDGVPGTIRGQATCSGGIHFTPSESGFSCRVQLLLLHTLQADCWHCHWQSFCQLFWSLYASAHFWQVWSQVTGMLDASR